MEYGTERESTWTKGLYIVQTVRELLEGAIYVCNDRIVGYSVCDFVFEMEGEIK